MPIHFDYNPDTGITQTFDYDPITDKIFLTQTQDVSKLLDHIKERRLTSNSLGRVEEFAHYAKIPAIVEYELRKKGLTLGKSSDTKAICKEIESNYPYLKMTDKKHYG